MFLFILSNIIFLCGFENLLATGSTEATDECNCKYECTNVEKDMNSILHCLKQCGFSIIPNLYNATTLNQIYIKFFHNFTHDERYEYLDRACETKGECLRGKRYEYAIPHFSYIDGFDKIIYQPLIAESALNFMKQEIIQNEGIYDSENNPIIFDTMTFITAPNKDIDISQTFHRDGNFGIKLQVPLINVTYNRGPVEIMALEGLHIDDIEKIRKKNCRVKGVVTLGTAILYQQNIFHRGTKNNHNNIRPVIDTSFLTLNEHIEQSYFETFTKKAQNDMAKNQKVFYEYCNQSKNCPGTKNTYCQKEENIVTNNHDVDLFQRISARARAKARDRARAKAKARARSRVRSLKFEI